MPVGPVPEQGESADGDKGFRGLDAADLPVDPVPGLGGEDQMKGAGLQRPALEGGDLDPDIGKPPAVALATAAMAALGSRAMMSTPRPAKDIVALPVPAPTSSARTCEALKPTNASTSSTRLSG